MNPHKSNGDDTKKFRVLQDEVMHFQKKGCVIITGDINARTGKSNDYIIPDKHNLLSEEGEDDDSLLFPERNSEDQKLDNRGEELLEMCRSLGLVILNGRKPGDMFGKVTSIHSNGCSVVDYVVSDHETFGNIPSLNVGKYSPWLSDHCPLHFSVSSGRGHSLGENPSAKEKAPKQYIWGEGSRENFLRSMADGEGELKKLGDMDIRETEGLLSSFTKTISEIANRAKLRVRKHRGGQNDGFAWFDDECRRAKGDLGKLNRELQLDPHSADLRQRSFFEHKKYKKMLRSKKRQHKNQIIADMALSKNDSKIFWKLLDRLKAKDQNDISIERMGTHKIRASFESILRGRDDPRCPPDSEERGPLDGEITMEELEGSSYVLRPGKATGPDPISYEMLACIVEKHPAILLKLFNSILLHNGKTPGWYKSILILLYKKGSRTEPLNYRGISLLSCVSKLFAAILNKRLLAYCIEKKILKPSQLGFVPGNRCSDAHIIIQNLIQKYCHRDGKKLYGCFVDFSKAFDTISREKLFEKLLKCGVNGNFYNVLKNMYFNDETRIRVGEHLSDVIFPNQGVRQGCILSPLLFNIYLSDLPLRLESAGGAGPRVGWMTFSNVIWADDLIILSESENGLNEMLGELSSYAAENNMTINIDKTKAMIFNKTGRFIRRNFKYRDSNIETVREYKYLGFLLVPSGSIVPGLHDLKSRGAEHFSKSKTKWVSNIDPTLASQSSCSIP